MVLLTSLVSFTDLESPLVLVNQHRLLHLQAWVDSINGWRSHSVEFLRHTLTFIASFLDSVGHFNALLIALKHVIFLFVELTESFHDLVLAWVVNLFESLLHLSLKLHVFLINFRDPLVFGVNQELEVLAFLLELPESSFPLDVARVSLLLSLDDLVM